MYSNYVTKEHFNTKPSNGYKNVITFILFTSCGILLMLSATSIFTHTQNLRISNCLQTTRETIRQARILANNKGEIGVNLDEFSKCFRVNWSGVGIARFMDERIFENVKCHDVNKTFIDESKMSVTTALASMAGSGNTWVRHLMEELTGYYTGSIYNSRQLTRIFKGENKTEGVIVVKTHRNVQMSRKFDRAILIVRDPFDAILAEFNRRYTNSKTGILTQKDFDYRLFQRKLRTEIDTWMTFNEDWIQQFPGPLFVVFYDKLSSDLPNSLAKVAIFLEADVSLKDLWCVNNVREGSYHRPPKPEWMSRSSFVDSDLENKILVRKRRLYHMCKKSGILTNL